MSLNLSAFLTAAVYMGFQIFWAVVVLPPLGADHMWVRMLLLLLPNELVGKYQSQWVLPHKDYVSS